MKDMPLLLFFQPLAVFVCLFVCFLGDNTRGTVADVDKIMWIIIT